MTLDLAKIKSDAEIIASRCDTLLMPLPVKDVQTLIRDAERLLFLVERGGQYHFRIREDGKCAAMDCGNGLTFIGKDFPSYREAVDAAEAKERP